MVFKTTALNRSAIPPQLGILHGIKGLGRSKAGRVVWGGLRAKPNCAQSTFNGFWAGWKPELLASPTVIVTFRLSVPAVCRSVATIRNCPSRI